MAMKRTQLKIAMVKKDVKGRDLANLIGVHETVISQVVNGRYNLDGDQERKIAEHLGEPRESLFGGGIHGRQG